MITCERCGREQERSQTESVLVELRDQSQRHASICLDCWDTTQPGEWVRLSKENGESEELRRLYWECDFCREIWRYDGIKVLARADQPPPYPEYLVCEECEEKVRRSHSLQLKVAVDCSGQKRNQTV